MDWYIVAKNIALHSNCDMIIADNSGNYKYINFLKTFDFKAVLKQKKQDLPQHTLSETHNILRDYFLAHSQYEWMLHLESDVLPPHNVIDDLLHMAKQHGSKVCAAMYHVGFGQNSNLMISLPSSWSDEYVRTFNTKAPISDLPYITGLPMRVYAAGIGCVLIHRSVLENISFRYVPKSTAFPDTFFYQDCFQQRIKVMLHTGVICKHLNQNWLTNFDYLTTNKN